ncbi:CPBP family intramembrane glutamic endopeptidase [Psychrobacter jeotgali]|uniref:CPBP family intramembrane glutamic endopeptidase n=1 Tax=Psychrobacter jeotgali TaxID=179010 RepID=UPI0019181578|nr:type II CAAX endopeptidase family protein [Psychrobacter jeotgali]
MQNHPPNLKPLSTPRANRVPLFSRFEVFALIIGTVIAFFMSQLIGVYVAGKWLLPATKSSNVGDIFFFGSSNGTIVSLSIMISLALLSVLTVSIIRIKKGRVRQYLALRPFSLATGLGMFGLLLLFMIGSQLLTYWLGKSPSVFVNPLYASVSSVWLLVAAMVVVAPIYEELVFRGILWSAIAEQFSAPRGAIVASFLTSVIFAVIHLQYGLYEISTIVVLALIFCYARIKSGSLLLPILLHIINNGIAMWQYLAQVG